MASRSRSPGRAATPVVSCSACSPGIRTSIWSPPPRTRRPAHRLDDRAPAAGRPATCVFGDTDRGALAAADLVFLALPHGESAALAAQLPARAQVVDLGADFRLADAARLGALLRRRARRHLDLRPARAARPAGADRRRHRVANTGCYAVAIILGAGAADRRRRSPSPDDVVVVAASGTSGAGRAAKPHLLGSEVMGDLSPYKVGAHQHVPEIKQATGATGRCRSRRCSRRCRAASWPPSPPARPAGRRRPAAPVLRRGVRRRAVRARAAGRAAGRTPPPPSAPTPCHLQADGRRRLRPDDRRSARMDNLGKGAAGQAVQNANLMLGLPETTGLSADGSRAVSVTAPKGFRAAGVAAGLKASGGADVALVVNDGPDCTAPPACSPPTGSRPRRCCGRQQVLARRRRARRGAQLRRRQRLHRPGRLPGHPRHRRARRGRAAAAPG